MDRFNQSEAFALMTNGHHMVEQELPTAVPILVSAAPQTGDRPFLAVEEAIHDDRNYVRLFQLLEVRRHPRFKVWRLSRGLQAVSWLAGVVLAALILWAIWSRPSAVATSLEVIVGLFIAATIRRAPAGPSKIARADPHRSGHALRGLGGRSAPTSRARPTVLEIGTGAARRTRLRLTGLTRMVVLAFMWTS
jgi:hypothetical protein